MTLHADIPTRSDLERLLATRAPGCVSVHMPTSPITQDAQTGRIELKNLAATATGQMRAAKAAEVRDRFALRSLDRWASADVATVARAATYGMVDTLLALLSGSRVLAVRTPEGPGGGPVAAILRYSP